MRLVSLGNSISLYTTSVHGFGTDAILLAHFSARHPSERVCDLGTGCGILPLLWCRTAPDPAAPPIDAVELQPEAIELATHSVAYNGLEARIRVIGGDLRDPALLPAGHYDLVTCNPPYFSAGSGRESSTPARRIARTEGEHCTLDEVTTAAARLLRFGGRFCLCHRPERLCDVLGSLRAAGLEPKRLQFVHQRSGDAPWLLLCEAKKGGKPGLTVPAPIILEDAATQAALYGAFAPPTSPSR